MIDRAASDVIGSFEDHERARQAARDMARITRKAVMVRACEGKHVLSFVRTAGFTSTSLVEVFSPRAARRHARKEQTAE